LRKLEQTIQALADEEGRQQELQLVLTRLEDFSQHVVAGLEQADWTQRRELIRTLVKRVEIGSQAVNVIFRVEPVTPNMDPESGSLPDCRRRDHCSLRRTYIRLRPLAIFRHSSFQPFLDQAEQAAIGHAVLDELHRPFMAHVVEEATNIRIKHPVHALPENTHSQRVERLMWAATRPEPIREALEIDLIYLVEDRHHGLLNNLSSSAAMPNGRCRPSAFGI
jgi:hypothetical protein